MNQPFKLKFDNCRWRVKQCPCGRSNKDGKFCPFEGYSDKGHCHSCGQTFMPEAGDRCSVSSDRSTKKNPTPNTGHRSPAFIPEHIFISTLQPAQNNFIRFLRHVFGKDIALQLIKQYYIATTTHWKGATVFWQIDRKGTVCAGKVLLYDSVTGKRVKDRKATWIHSIEKIADYKLHQCLFGEHLLNLPENVHKPVAIVESEKTAIIASVYLPQFVWLASGGRTMLSDAKCKVLADRNVTLFPDANAFDEWKAIANRHAFNISTFHEQHSTEAVKAAGLDIADYLLQYTVSAFNNEAAPLKQPVTYSDILEVQQYLHEIEARNSAVPQQVWRMFWNLYDNRFDGEAWRGLVGFIGRN